MISLGPCPFTEGICSQGPCQAKSFDKFPRARYNIFIMRTKKKPEVTESPEPREERAPPVESENGLERKSFAFYTNAKGDVQWDKMREKTKAELREFLKRPDIGKALGVETPPEIATVEIMSVEWCGNLYDVIGRIESALAIKWKGIPKEIAEQVFSYGPQEKALLGPPTARVINKYATDWMARYKDEIALGLLLVSVTLAKVQLCNAAMISANGPQAVPEKESARESDPVVQ